MQKRSMKLKLPFVLLLLLILFSVGIAYRTYAHADDEAAVRGARMKSALSFEKNDLPMASQVWVNDESLTIFESGHANYRDHKQVYQLDASGQEKAREFAGQKVKVTGRVTGKTIHVTAIEATS